jgi:hypothetical protein
LRIAVARPTRQFVLQDALGFVEVSRGEGAMRLCEGRNAFPERRAC